MKQYMPKFLKTKNRMMIFEILRSQNITSRAELVRLTGMSFPTVLKIVDKLLELGIVIELEETEHPAGAGRRGHLLRFNPRAYFAIGIEFEGQIANLGLVDLLGTCQYCHSIHLPLEKSSINLAKLTQEIHALLELAANEQIPVLGVGIGFPAMVHPQNQSILHMTYLNIHQETPFAEVFPEFTSSLPIPLFLDNDVNYACLGEAFLRRQNTGYDNLLYLTLGTGCGAGFVMNDELWHGSNYKSGEVGNMLVPPNRIPNVDYQEAVPFESLINLEAIYKRFSINLQQNPGIPEPVRQDIIEYLCPYLSYVLTNLVHILDIQNCILTGIIPQALGPALFERVQETIDQILVHNSLHLEPSISRDSGIIGAAVTVFNQQLEVLFEQ